MITLRSKKLTSGKYSLYLDVYTTDNKGNKMRQYEFLKLKVSKDYSKIKNILVEDRDNMDLAGEIRRKRELEVTGELNGVKARLGYNGHLPVIDYLESVYYKTGNERIKTLLYHLKRYTDNEKLTFGELDTVWLNEFKDYLVTNVSQNAAVNYMKLFRARVKDAFRQDIIMKNPFDKFEMPRELESERTTLDAAEVEKLIDTPFPSHPHLRLGFLFSCFTGLRTSDIYALKWEDVVIEKDAKKKPVYYLNIRPIKTQKSSGKILKMPLTRPAIEVLKELEKEKKPDEKIFCKLPSDRNARNLLKLWAARAGIKKNVYFHAARHTFATLSLTYGIDIYSVSKLLGHTDIRNTEIYAKIVDEKKRTEIKKLPIL
jgi:integrase